MAVPRAAQVNLSDTPHYHCMSRCVRQAYLCGVDAESGKDYGHRKGWIVDRIKFLSKVFSVHICTYAVMSNHYHLVLFIDNEAPTIWDRGALKARWKRLFPHRVKFLEMLESYPEHEEEVEAIYQSIRARLCDLSWFMRCLNEPIARRCNAEEKCKGRFWDGRFRSQALLDEGALITAMTYVDLNPIRAGMVETLEDADFTSIQERLDCALKDLRPVKAEVTPEQFEKMCKAEIEQSKQPDDLLPLLNGCKPVKDKLHIDFNLSDYILLVEETGRIIRDDKRGHISDAVLPIFQRLHIKASCWTEILERLETHFYYAIGSSIALSRFGERPRLRMVKGVGKAKKYFH